MEYIKIDSDKFVINVLFLVMERLMSFCQKILKDSTGRF